MQRRETAKTLIAVTVAFVAYFTVKALAEPLGKWPAILLAAAAAPLTAFLVHGLLERLAKLPRD